MKRTRHPAVAAALLLSLWLAACSAASSPCTDPLGCLEIPAGSPLVLGALLASAGEQAEEGEASLLGIQQALDEAGELLGHPLELAQWDTDCSEKDARRGATSLALNPEVIAVIGPTCPGQYEVAAPIFSDAGLALLQPAPGLTAAADLTRSLLAAITRVAFQDAEGALHVPRQALLEALQGTP